MSKKRADRFAAKIAKLAYNPEARNLEEVLDFLTLACKKGILDNNTMTTINGALEVIEMRVRDIMVPRAQITTVERADSFTELLEIITRSGHSRFPVIGDDKDQVIGILLAKDLLNFTLNHERFELDKLLRDVTIIPESKRLNSLLNDFKASRQHMALVVDEYGSISGLVTIEDVLEVIVGDIGDEHDTDAAQNISVHQKGHYNVNALTEIEEFNQHFQVELSDADADTIGGYLMRELGRVPKRGEVIHIAGLEFIVLGADSRRIYRLKVTPQTTAPNEA